MVRWPRMAMAALMLGLLWALPAAAQEADAEPSGEPADEQTEAARASFQAGLELADQGAWEQASARFREALALRDSPAVRTNLAISLAESGRTVEAVGELDRVLADPSLDATGRADVATRRAALVSGLGQLRVDVSGASSGTTVTVDGQPWRGEGTSTFVEPGTFEVRLSNEDGELDRQDAEVRAGADVNVRFSLLADAAAGGADDTPWIVGLTAGILLAVAGGVALTIALLPMQESTDADFDSPILEID